MLINSHSPASDGRSSETVRIEIGYKGLNGDCALCYEYVARLQGILSIEKDNIKKG